MKWDCGHYHQLFNLMPLDVIPNQEFLEFISKHGDKQNLPNLKLLLDLEKKHPGMFIKVMLNYDYAKSYRNVLNDRGTPKHSWRKILEGLYSKYKYIGVTGKNVDIAEIFGRKKISQALFNSTNELRQEARRKNIPEHILGKPLSESTILAEIERIREQTKNELENKGNGLVNPDDKRFTYEWLSKYDPRNYIMEILLRRNESTERLDRDKVAIARASIIAPDVQNLVVINSKGNIVGKATIYVNKAKAIAIVDEFEIIQIKRYEDYRGRIIKTKEVVEIYSAFYRGLDAFIEEYDRQNPDKPLTQMYSNSSLGMLNPEFRIRTITFVPSEYGFAEDRCRDIYYSREKMLKQYERTEVLYK